MPYNEEFSIDVEPWKGENAPSRILVIRYHAFGDLMITMPYLQALAMYYPGTRIDLVTRKEVSVVPLHLGIFHRVYAIAGKRNPYHVLLFSVLMIPRFWMNKYDVVIDLQNNRISRIIRKTLRPQAWAAFNTQAPFRASLRTRRTLEAVFGHALIPIMAFTPETDDITLWLCENGYKPEWDLVVLNPAGYCASRKWPIGNYLEFARLWLKEINPETQFVLLLTKEHKETADEFHRNLRGHILNLTGRADQWQAFQTVGKCRFMLTEDSGLMHVSWIQQVPTLALFSSSRADWSAPEGAWSVCLDSSDLECGPCMLERCKFGDNRCLTRYSPEFVLTKAREMLQWKN